MEIGNFLLKTITLIGSGIILLRITGRKSISQMTIAQTVIMISIGSLIIQPIIDKNILRTISAATIFVLFLILIEWLELKFNIFETIITGKTIVVIKDGQILKQNLNKIRLTADQLEIRLRQKGIANISDIKIATLEANGQLGYELIDDAKPLTKGEFKQLMGAYNLNQSPKPTGDLFTEVVQKDKNISNDINNNTKN